MSMLELSEEFSSIKNLFREINEIAPAGTPAMDSIRADLAGLLVVTLAATYENCVKIVLINYADNKNANFSYFVERQFEKLNSRITVRDLQGYTKKFDSRINAKFKKELEKVQRRVGSENIQNKYEQILAWRHAFAHAREKLTTLEEAYTFHCYGKYVLYAFSQAFTRS